MPCKIDGCISEKIQGHGLCHKHYMRQRRTGSPHVVRKAGRGTGITKHFMYGSWSGMIGRCHNPNHSSYARYGAKGVFVCDRWRYSFTAFLEDMGERPEGLTLDRINPTGPYAPDNCRWASKKEQRANLSEEGAARAHQVQSEKRKEYWRKWREQRGRVGTHREMRNAGLLPG